MVTDRERFNLQFRKLPSPLFSAAEPDSDTPAQPPATADPHTMPSPPQSGTMTAIAVTSVVLVIAATALVSRGR